MLRQLTRAAFSPVAQCVTPVTSVRLFSNLGISTSPSTNNADSLPPQSESTSSAQPNGPSIRVINIAKKRELPSLENSPTASVSNARAAPLEPYVVTRTRTGGLPVYRVMKGSGTLKLTRIRRVDGNLNALRSQLEQYLQPTPKRVEVNELTRHVVVKGDYRTQVETFLTAKGF